VDLDNVIVCDLKGIANVVIYDDGLILVDINYKEKVENGS